MAGKKTSWFDDMLMAASRRGNDIVAAAADLADKYGITPADAVAWIAKNVEGRSPQEVARIRRNLKPISSNRALVEAGAASNEARFRQAGGRGARKPEDVTAPVRLGAAAYKPAAVPKAAVRQAPTAARTVSKYLRESSPAAVAQDAANLALSGYEAFVRDPYGSLVENAVYANPITALAAAPFDYAAIREGSQMLDPYTKEDAEAAKAQEMIDGPLATNQKVVAVGDFNTTPEGPESEAYALLTDPANGKLRDIWPTVSDEVGYTCCQAADLLNGTSEANQRIDLILTRTRAVKATSADLVGDEARTSGGLWASDHFGVVAHLTIP